MKKIHGILMGALVLGLVLPLAAAPAKKAPAKGQSSNGFEFHFQVVTPNPIKEQAGGEARTISYGKMGKQRTVVIHVRTTAKQSLTDWVAKMAPTAKQMSKGAYVGIWYVEKPKGPLVSRVFFTNLRPVRAAETHKLADGSGEEYEMVFTYDAQKTAKGPIDKAHPLPL